MVWRACKYAAIVAAAATSVTAARMDSVLTVKRGAKAFKKLNPATELFEAMKKLDPVAVQAGRLTQKCIFDALQNEGLRRQLGCQHISVQNNWESETMGWKSIFNRLDVDRSNQVTPEEFMAFYRSYVSGATLFDRLDKDGDGYLRQKEVYDGVVKNSLAKMLGLPEVEYRNWGDSKLGMESQVKRGLTPTIPGILDRVEMAQFAFQKEYFSGMCRTPPLGTSST